MQQTRTLRDGVARCARYAFGPNKLHLCGPDANREVYAYLKEGVVDFGLRRILGQFQTLYPYLRSIAEANQIADPFDDRVVHAYWIGNALLETIPLKTLFHHLVDVLKINKRQKKKDFDELTERLPHGAKMHHSFHVLNIYKRTGHLEHLHTLESMDACRVSWGKVVSIDGPKITVMRKRLALNGNTLYLTAEEKHTVIRKLEDEGYLDEMKPGDLISMHWYVPCEVITPQDVRSLEFYTQKHISLANLTH